MDDILSCSIKATGIFTQYNLISHTESIYGNSLPNKKFLAWSSLKVFADDKLNVIKTMFAFNTVENIVSKGKNAGVTSIFSFSHKVFKRLLPKGP